MLLHTFTFANPSFFGEIENRYNNKWIIVNIQTGSLSMAS